LTCRLKRSEVGPRQQRLLRNKIKAIFRFCNPGQLNPEARQSMKTHPNTVLRRTDVNIRRCNVRRAQIEERVMR
jgi:hypothetical protein